MSLLVRDNNPAVNGILERSVVERSFGQFNNPMDRFFVKFGQLYYGKLWCNTISTSSRYLLGGSPKDSIMIIDLFERATLRQIDVGSLNNTNAAIAYSDEIFEVVQMEPKKMGRYAKKHFANKIVFIGNAADLRACLAGGAAELIIGAVAVHVGRRVSYTDGGVSVETLPLGEDISVLAKQCNKLFDKWVVSKAVDGSPMHGLRVYDGPSVVTVPVSVNVARPAKATAKAPDASTAAASGVKKPAAIEINWDGANHEPDYVVPAGESAVVVAKEITPPGQRHWAVSKAIKDAETVVIRVARAGNAAKWTIHDWASSVLYEWLKRFNTPNDAINRLTIVGCSPVELNTVLEYVRRNVGANRPLLD